MWTQLGLCSPLAATSSNHGKNTHKIKIVDSKYRKYCQVFLWLETATIIIFFKYLNQNNAAEKLYIRLQISRNNLKSLSKCTFLFFSSTDTL